MCAGCCGVDIGAESGEKKEEVESLVIGHSTLSTRGSRVRY
jgi:hypothetical protein